MVGMKVGARNEDFTPPDNCVEEKILDEVSFNAHLKHYIAFSIRDTKRVWKIG